MSVTTGTGAKKTAGTDNWRTIISVHDDTVDVYDKVKAAAAIFAAPYDSTATYAAGDQCTHDGRWYVANQAISTAEDWTPAHWTEITIASKLDTANVYNGLDKTASGFALDARQGKSLSEAIANIATVISGTTNNSGHAISAGEYFIANGAKYKASATIDTSATWSDKSTSVSDHDLINALNSKLTSYSLITDNFSVYGSGKTINDQRIVGLYNSYTAFISATFPSYSYTGEWLLQSSAKPHSGTKVIGIEVSTGKPYKFHFGTDGYLVNSDNIVAGTYLFNFTFYI